MARRYADEIHGWALAKRGKAAKAIKVRETGDGVPLGTQRDLGFSYLPLTAARVAFRAWAERFRRASQGDNPRLSDILADNLERLEHEGHLTRQVKARYDRLNAFFGAVGVKDISHELCKAFAKHMEAEGYALVTIWGDLSSLRSALRSAYGRKKIDAPCHEFCWNISQPKGRQVTLTPEQFWRWYDHALPHIQLFLLIALLTSARREAIFSLRWEHIDFETGIIDFTASMRKKKSALDKGYQKGRAKVVMSSTLRTALLAAKHVAKTPFVIEYGGRHVRDVTRGYTTARKRAGLPEEVTPHVLRHTALTWATESGIDINKVADLAGHADSRTTETVYVHKSGSATREAAEAVEKKLGSKLRVVK